MKTNYDKKDWLAMMIFTIVLSLTLTFSVYYYMEIMNSTVDILDNSKVAGTITTEFQPAQIKNYLTYILFSGVLGLLAIVFICFMLARLSTKLYCRLVKIDYNKPLHFEKRDKN